MKKYNDIDATVKGNMLAGMLIGGLLVFSAYMLCRHTGMSAAEFLQGIFNSIKATLS